MLCPEHPLDLFYYLGQVKIILEVLDPVYGEDLLVGENPHHGPIGLDPLEGVAASHEPSLLYDVGWELADGPGVGL